MDHASLGAWIRRGREVRDLTQEALAEEVGCAVQTVRAFEHGWRRPSRSMAGRLAMALGVPPEERDAFIRLARAPLGSPAAPEAPAAPADPAAYLARLAGEAYAQLLGPRQHEWQDRLDAELEQLRAALTWRSSSRARAGPGGSSWPCARRARPIASGTRAATRPRASAGWSAGWIWSIARCWRWRRRPRRRPSSRPAGWPSCAATASAPWPCCTAAWRSTASSATGAAWPMCSTPSAIWPSSRGTGWPRPGSTRRA